jgi:hypothetical protein
MITEKYQFHVPLYRIHSKLAHLGIQVARSTLTNLEHGLGELLDPVCDQIHRSILREKVFSADETHRKVWNKEEKKHKQEYVWALSSTKEIFYAMGPGRDGQVATQLIGKGKTGVIMVDKYGGYNCLKKSCPDLVIAYCMTHAFRNFRDAAGEEQELASVIMTNYFGVLYTIEETIQAEGMSLKQKAAYRLKYSLPVMDSLKQHLMLVQAEFSQRPASKLLTACNYMLSDWDGFTVFITNPEVPIDNNAIERRFRGHAIGRKNWLWNMSEEGAEWVCNFYTIVESCILIDLSPRQYLDAVLPQLRADLKPDYAALTPRRWKEAQGVAEVEAKAA